ncbi:MAG: flagellar basal body P-ring protein FlgI [Planctomycetaceae bacterium]|nr:flagellar basal body P-ring protein FlgI [Planctomycetaceae bacterium]
MSVPFPVLCRILLCFVLCTGIILLPGCSPFQSFGKKDKNKKLIPDKIADDISGGKTMLIGDYISINNMNFVEVRGAGLVQGLSGTGGDDINSQERQLVYEDMQKRGLLDISARLASPTTAVVNIVGYVKPGIQKDDLFDVKVMLPAETDAKSLRGGWLMNSPLKVMAVLDSSMKEGKPYAFVEGPILVDPMATETTNAAGLKSGVVLSGARSKISRPIYLNMKPDYASAFITDRIAKEINNRFYINTGQKKGMATADSDVLIVLDVHPTYRNNVARYVQIVRSIACYETPPKQMKRIEKLKEELRVPETSQRASFQLEALGKSGIEPLKTVLKSTNTEVLFNAGTALAYLGDGSAAKILADIARKEPAFRVFALDALSVLKQDIEAELCLQELLQVPSAETRYGAFRALCYRNPYDKTIRGEVLRNEGGSQFSYHGITTNAPPMVHITKSSRPEVVLFGNDIHLKRPFTLNAGPKIFVNGQNEQVVITRFGRLDEKRTVTNKLDDIIRAVVDLEGTYPDVSQLIQEAARDNSLSCRLEIDCLPEEYRIYRRPGGSPEEESLREIKVADKLTPWQRMNPKVWFEANPGGKSSDEVELPNRTDRE